MNNEMVSPGDQGAVSQGPFVALFITIMLGFAIVWITFGLTHTQILYGVAGIVFFIVSFFSMKVGLIIMALAMIFSPELSVGSVGVRDVTIRIEDLLIPVLALAWLVQVTMRRQWKLFIGTPINGLIGILIALSVFSTIRGALTGWVQIVTGFFYIFKTIEYFIIFFLVVNYVREEKQIKLFLFFVLLTASLLGFYTLRQVPSVEIFTEHRITAPFENVPEPGTVGGYMAFLILIILSLFLYEKRASMRWLYVFLMVVLMVPFLYTLSRTSYMALLAGGLFIAIVSRHKVFIAILIGLLLSSPLWAPASVKERIAFTWQDAKHPGRTLGVDYASQERFYAYRRMWSTCRTSPVIGWGVTSWQTPDSQWARTIHEIGFIGLWLWLWIFYRLFKMSYWLFKHEKAGMFKGLALGYMAALLGIIIHGNGAITLYIVRIMEPFWFITGLVVTLYLNRVNEIQEAT